MDKKITFQPFNFKSAQLLTCLIVVCCFFGIDVYAQNVFSGEPVQWVGRPNGYSTIPYNSDYRTTSYRKISTAASNPADGRGQWATTINVQSSGGDITPDNMPGGGGAGWLLISGPSGNRFQNKWNFSGVGQGALNSINNVILQSGGQDMGLNMGAAGYYTFAMRDAGYANTEFYVGYTSNAPVTVARTGQTYNPVTHAAVINISSSATPSAGENIYVRYRANVNNFTSGTAVVQATGGGTSWSADIPQQSCGSTIYYYVYSSTRTLSQTGTDSESDRSLAALRYDDNAGSNYSYAPAPGVISCAGTNSTCNGSNDGTASVTVSGNGPFTYLWSNASTNSATFGTFKDNTIFEQNQDNSNGAGQFMYTGKLNNGFKSRALLMFDLSSVPSGATITAASLTLNCSRVFTGTTNYDLHKITQDWGEGTSDAGSPGGQGTAATANDATWLDRFFGVNTWTTAGGDFNATGSASQIVNGTGFYTWSSAAMISDVQAWIDNSSPNYGWMIKGSETANGQAKRFDTKENTAPANVPALALTWATGISGSISNLSAGTYTVTVTDASGCTASCFYTVTEPAPVTITATTSISVCRGATSFNIPYSATTGSPDEYVLNPGTSSPYPNFVQVNTSLPASPISVSIDGSATPGVYLFELSVDNSITTCVQNGVTTIALTVLPDPTVSASASPSSICAGSSSTLTAGGAATYSWQPGNLTGTTVSVSPANTTTYTVTGTTANGCTATATATVTLMPNPIVITNMKSDALFATVGTAGITAEPTGCTFLWSPGGQTSNYIQNQPPGTYAVNITAPGGCTKTKTIIIN